MSDASDTTAHLVSQLREGSDDALAELFSQHHERLKRIVKFRLDHRIAGRVSESDVVQETFLAASKRLDHFRRKPEMAFFLWLRLLANQQLAELHRHHLQVEMRDARKEISIERPVLSPHTSMAIAAQLAGSVTSPSHALTRIERIAELEAALNEMEPIDREVIALRHFEELSNIEVADVLGIGIQAASKRYVRAIKRMKEILSSVSGFDQG